MIKRGCHLFCLGVAVSSFMGAAPAPERLTPAEERLIAALPVVPAGLNADCQLAVKPVKTVEATYQVTIRAPELKAAEWLLMVPKPVDLPGQRIIRGGCQPQGVEVADLSVLHQPLWQVRVPVDDPKLQTGVKLAVTTRLELSSRKLVPRRGGPPAAGPRLPEPERKLFLRRTGWFDYDSPVLGAWMTTKDLRRGAREGEVAFGRRVFLAQTRSCGYEYLGEQNRAASHVCAVERSDCGGLSVLFVAVMRAQGIPARIRAGRWAQSAVADQRIGRIKYFQEHVKAEFFAQGLGWVPVDVSSGVLHDKTPAGLEYFGNDRGDFITLHLDHDLVFDTHHFGVQRMPLLQRPTYWATGRGGFSDSVMEEKWEVKPFSPR